MTNPYAFTSWLNPNGQGFGFTPQPAPPQQPPSTTYNQQSSAPGGATTVAAAGGGAMPPAAPASGGLPPFLAGLMPQGNPFEGKSNMLMGMGLGLLGGRGRAEGFRLALEGAQRGKAQDQHEKEEQEKKDKEKKQTEIAASLFPKDSPGYKLALAYPQLAASMQANIMQEEATRERWTDSVDSFGQPGQRSSKTNEFKHAPRAAKDNKKPEYYMGYNEKGEEIDLQKEPQRIGEIVAQRDVANNGQLQKLELLAPKKILEDMGQGVTKVTDPRTNDIEYKQQPNVVDYEFEDSLGNQWQVFKDGSRKQVFDSGVKTGARVKQDLEMAKLEAEARKKGGMERYGVAQAGEGGSIIMPSLDGGKPFVLRAPDVKSAESIDQDVGREGRVARARTEQFLPPTIDPKTGATTQRSAWGGADKVIGGPQVLVPEAQKQRLDRVQSQPRQYQTEYDKTSEKGFAERNLKMTQDAYQSQRRLAGIGLAKAAASNPEFKSGAGAETLGRISSALQVVGLGDGTLAGLQDVFRGQTSESVYRMLGSLGNQISNADREFISQVVGSLGQTKGSVQALVEMAELQAKRDIQVNKLRQDYLKGQTLVGKKPMLDEGFDIVLNDWLEANPLMTEQKRDQLIALAQSGDKFDLGSPRIKSTVPGRSTGTGVRGAAPQPYKATNGGLVTELPD